MKLKICGITTTEVAKRVLALDPDAIGIYCRDKMGANYTDLDTAAKIASIANELSVDAFYLTYAITAKEILEDCRAIGNSHVQLIGDIPLEEIRKIKAALPALKTVKVIGVTGQESEAEAMNYGHDDAVDQLLLDSRFGSARGGTGKTHDWTISERIARASSKPTWLAGGIKLGNLRDAMASVTPYGIDVETGVQNPDGSKDYSAIKQFIELAHGS